MAYITQSDIASLITQDDLVRAIDDNSDGQPDPGVWDSLELAARETIDGALCAVYRTPFAAPPPSIIAAIAKVLVCDMLFRRRGVPDASNPWAKHAAEARLTLRRLATGEDTINGVTRSAPAPILISEPARTFSESGRILI
jgi:phage gp36-like protein